jgi:hypothetical protein
MFYLQIAAAVVSLLLGLTQITKESQPIVQNVHEIYQDYRQQKAYEKARQIAGMNIQWQLRGNDGVWQYYSDPTGRFWARVNSQGICEYSENPSETARGT